MDLTTFKRVLSAFADRPLDVDYSGGNLVVVIRDEIIEAELFQKEGDLWVCEGAGTPLSSYKWITNRVAKLPLLADRILNYVEEEKNFVKPSGAFLDELDHSPEEESVLVEDAMSTVCEALSRKTAGVSKVLYLTSDAGEGKTTIINQISRSQAQRFKDGDSDWLMVPIRLGGRPFMRLDDVVVAELTNRMRFMLFYDAFLELVRLNVIVPALDGFEEVFIESATGEGVSALGNLVSGLDGEGRLLVAARKAYFEIQSFSMQARFFDSLQPNSSVELSRLSLDRWSKKQFCEYAELRGLKDSEKLYDVVSERLMSDHPLLTRAVLVHRLIDVAEDYEIDNLLDRLGKNPEDYFYEFVDAIIEREAHHKWIDRQGDGAAEPLISVREHHVLLAMLAREMWINSTDSLRVDYADLVADIFSSDHKKPPVIARQVKERLHHHSLLVTYGQRQNQIGFDHQDFQWFFLGEAFANDLIGSSDSDLIAMLRVGSVPDRTADAAISVAKRFVSELGQIRDRLLRIGRESSETSYTKENAGLLLARIFGEQCMEGVTVESLMFPSDSLRSNRFNNMTFRDCHFKSTSLAGSELNNIKFERCRFDRLELPDVLSIHGCLLDRCEVDNLFVSSQDLNLFDPGSINYHLNRIGFALIDSEHEGSMTEELQGMDQKTELAEHALRAFMRSTHINENVFKLKMGRRGSEFFQNVLPVLLEEGILKEVQYKGSGGQRRFKLNVPMRNLEAAIRKCGKFSDFINELKQSEH